MAEIKLPVELRADIERICESHNGIHPLIIINTIGVKRFSHIARDEKVPLGKILVEVDSLIKSLRRS